MAVLGITAAGRVASVCGSCGATADAPMNEREYACCENPARFRKQYIVIWAASSEWIFQLFALSWVDSDTDVVPSDLWMASIRDYVRTSAIDVRKIALITQV